MPDPSAEDDYANDGGLVAKGVAGDNAAPLTITEISNLLKRTVEDRFGYVKLRGELSGVKRAASGHLYCCLKDEGAVIDGVMWRGGVQALGFVPEDGIEVVASGKLTTYPGRSKYQIVIERMEIAGEGALLALLEKTRRRLEAEGLFALERKRPLPFLPALIGVITSPTGAVIRDILHRLADRFPSRVLVWPVLVQGQGSAEQVAAALRGFAELAAGGAIPRPDLLIVARGGGSIEDLWSFNEEIVVRAIAGSPIPVISAVGHETDTTLIDHAADLRAPTPTAAAELAVPVRSELLALLDELSARKRRCLGKRASDARERFALTTCRWPAADTLLGPRRQRIDEVGERLPRGLSARAHKAEALMNLTASRLRPDLLAQKLARAGDQLGAAAKMLLLVHPDRPLGRGFVRVTAAADGRTLTHAADARAAGLLLLRFGDGEVPATADGSAPAAAAKVERTPKRAYAPPQPNLFD